jgi:hypothetical protein
MPTVWTAAAAIHRDKNTVETVEIQKFWKDKWLNGKRIKDLAPSLYNVIPKRIVNSRTIYEAITDRKWISDIKGPLTVGVLIDYLQLWNMTSAWQLQPEVEDKHVFSIAPTGIYSAKTAYEGFFLGSVVFCKAQNLCNKIKIKK